MPRRVLLSLSFISAWLAGSAVAVDPRDFRLNPDFSPIDGTKLSFETNLNRGNQGEAGELFSHFRWKVAGDPQDVLHWGLSFSMNRAGDDTLYLPSAGAIFRFALSDALRLSADGKLTRGEDDTAEAWSLQADYRLATQWSLIGRTSGESYASQSRQIGFTYDFLPTRAAIDVLYGQQGGDDETRHHGSLGLRINW
jgi:hypothetical protein